MRRSHVSWRRQGSPNVSLANVWRGKVGSMDVELKERMRKIEVLAGRLKMEADTETRACALELLQELMEFHAAGLDRLMEIVAGSDAGWSIIGIFGRDEIVSQLLLLHGLHPVDLQTRVVDALDKVRPYLLSHRGNVELIEIQGGTVRLRLIGSCNGCPSSSVTLRTAIEKAIHDAAPDVVSIECEG